MKTFIIRKFTWPDPEKEAPTIIEIIPPTGRKKQVSSETNAAETAGYIVAQYEEIDGQCEVLFPQEQKITRETKESPLVFLSGLSKDEMGKFYEGFKRGLIAKRL